MGKSKHKKHHRHGLDDEEGSSQDGGGSSVAASGGEGSGGSSGLKLILKVGSGSAKSHGEKHKKKKKKKDRKKEKEHKHKHHHKDKSLRNAAAELLLNPGSSLKEEVIMKSPNLVDLAQVQVPTHVEVVRPQVPDLVVPRLLPLPLSQPIKIEDVRPPEVAIAAKPINESSRKNLQKLLEHFLHHLQKKDVNQVFALPVDDLFAPGYSEIIKEPMDFSTIRLKLNAGKYHTLAAFKSDFELVRIKLSFFSSNVVIRLFFVVCFLCLIY